MAWIESHQTLREHPKTKRLCRLLTLDRWQAVGLLQFLWWWALDYAPEGDLSAFSDEDIADAVDWEREPGALVAALIEAGFLDGGRRLHDWDQYAEKRIARRRANAERMAKARAAAALSLNGARAEHVQDTCAESVGLPERPERKTGKTGKTGTPTQPFPHGGKGYGAAAAANIPQDVIERLSRLPSSLDAAGFHAAAESALISLGFACQREVPVPDRGDGRGGRIDLFAERRGQRIAFEFDRESPRQKSISKLESVLDAARVVVLRVPFDGPLPDGLDAVISPPTPHGGKPPAAAKNQPWNDEAIYGPIITVEGIRT